MLFRATIIAIVVILHACSGGTTSGTTGGTRNSIHVGTYTGTATATASASGFPDQTGSEAVAVFVQSDGNVNIGNADMIFASAILNGDRFTVTLPAALIADEPGCTGTASLDATLSNGMITGNFTSSGVTCFGIAVSVTGTLEATRVSAIAAINNGPHGSSKALSTAIAGFQPARR